MNEVGSGGRTSGKNGIPGMIGTSPGAGPIGIGPGRLIAGFI